MSRRWGYRTRLDRKSRDSGSLSARNLSLSLQRLCDFFHQFRPLKTLSDSGKNDHPIRHQSVSLQGAGQYECPKKVHRRSLKEVRRPDLAFALFCHGAENTLRKGPPFHRSRSYREITTLLSTVKTGCSRSYREIL